MYNLADLKGSHFSRQKILCQFFTPFFRVQTSTDKHVHTKFDPI